MERNGIIIPAAIKIEGFEKHYFRFDLGPLNLEIPQGFTTAIIGENGAGKTTLLDALGGISSSDGKITWLEKYTDLDQEDGQPKNLIGWSAANRYFPMGWTIKNVQRAMSLAFEDFDSKLFDSICREFGLGEELDSKKKKKLSAYSDGNRARLVIAALLARNTRLMIFDEPDAALDPLIRDTLASKFRDYISRGEGENTILFSTHNVADMESLVDYVIYLDEGNLLAQGFVEDLREQYRYVHGQDSEGKAFEKLCSLEEAESFSRYAVEIPTLQQLSVMILRSAGKEA